jgi:hypothetical protein
MPEQQTMDLGALAIERCLRAFGSVAQLADNDRETYAIVLMVAASMLGVAADLMQEGMEKQNGNRPDDAKVLHQVVGDLLDGLRVEWKSMPKSQSKKR